MMSDQIAIVTGGSSGLGRYIVNHLSTAYDNSAGDRLFFKEVHNWDLGSLGSPNGIDVRDEVEVFTAAQKFKESGVNVLVNCAGVNHIAPITKLEESEWYRLMDTNAKALWLTAKHLADYMRGGTILNIVSNASHMPMTNSIAYNASKGAAAIMTAQMSRELIKTHGITVFSISPNKLRDTAMSAYIDKTVCEQRGWTLEQARAYQLQNLPAGEETDPNQLAEFIGFLLSTKERHKYLAGCDIPYGL